MKFVNNIDLGLNQLLNFRVQMLASDPGSPLSGQVWYNTASNRLKYYDGSTVHVLATSAGGSITGILDTAPIVSTDNLDGTFTISIDAATTSTPGSLSAADKQKLDNVPSNTNTELSGKAASDHNHSLDSLNNVTITANAEGELLKWDGAAWVNNTLAEAGVAASTHPHATSDVTGLDTALSNKVETSLLGAADGVATLDGTGKVPVAQLPDTVTGALDYQGTWNATTNTPTLASATGTKGDYYRVSTAGSTNLDGVTDWKIGDWALFNGTAWEKLDQTESVTSVATKTGDVTLVAADIGGVGTNLSNIDSAATARSNLGATGKFSTSIGNGTNTTLTVTHNLGTQDVVVFVREVASPFAQVMCDVEITDTNNVACIFAVAPTANQYRVTVVG